MVISFILACVLRLLRLALAMTERGGSGGRGLLRLTLVADTRGERSSPSLRGVKRGRKTKGSVATARGNPFYRRLRFEIAKAYRSQ